MVDVATGELASVGFAFENRDIRAGIELLQILARMTIEICDGKLTTASLVS
jgi:hypothetical protein